jgi:hypothetical protein
MLHGDACQFGSNLRFRIEQRTYGKSQFGSRIIENGAMPESR